MIVKRTKQDLKFYKKNANEKNKLIDQKIIIKNLKYEKFNPRIMNL